MAGLFERIKTAYENRGETKDWQNITDTLNPKKAMKRFEGRGERTPEPTTLQKRIKNTAAAPSNIGVGSSPLNSGGIKPPTEKAPDQGRRTVKPKPIADGMLAEQSPAPEVKPRKPSFNAQDTIPKNLERFDLGSTLKDIYKKNASKFGPDTKTGGRDIYEMKDGERTGRILESSTWLKDGNAFSSNAWEKTVGGQPNQGYDPNAIMPEGYRNEAGTFIPGPRVKDWEPLFNARNQGERDIAMKAFAEKAGTLDPESGRIGSELARRGEQKLEGIKGRYLESAAKIRANADVTSAGIQADAYASRGADSGPSAAQKAPEASWKESEAGKFYDAKSSISPGQQIETELANDIMKKWKKHQGDINSFYKTLSDEESEIFKKYYQ